MLFFWGNKLGNKKLLPNRKKLMIERFLKHRKFNEKEKRKMRKSLVDSWQEFCLQSWYISVYIFVARSLPIELIHICVYIQLIFTFTAMVCASILHSVKYITEQSENTQKGHFSFRWDKGCCRSDGMQWNIQMHEFQVLTTTFIIVSYWLLIPSYYLSNAHVLNRWQIARNL